MNNLEKIQFVTSLCESISEQIVVDIGKGKIPENWDGIELRWLIAERFNRQTKFGDNRRKREYNNTVLVNNL